MILKTIFIYCFTYYFCAYGMYQEKEKIKSKDNQQEIQSKKSSNNKNQFNKNLIQSNIEISIQKNTFLYNFKLHSFVREKFYDQLKIKKPSSQSVKSYLTLCGYIGNDIKNENFIRLFEKIFNAKYIESQKKPGENRIKNKIILQQSSFNIDQYIEKEKYILAIEIINKHYKFNNDLLTTCNIKINEDYSQLT